MAAARPSQCKKMIVLLYCRRRTRRQQLQQQEDSSNQPRARGSEDRAAQVQLDRVTGALGLRGVGLAESLVAAVAQVVLVGQLAAATAAAAADSQSPSSREGSRAERGAHNFASAARRVTERVARTEEQKMETECNGAAAESAADSQAVARARQQQQQQNTQLPQPQAQAGETEAAAAEEDTPEDGRESAGGAAAKDGAADSQAATARAEAIAQHKAAIAVAERQERKVEEPQSSSKYPLIQLVQRRMPVVQQTARQQLRGHSSNISSRVDGSRDHRHRHVRRKQQQQKTKT